MVNLPISGYRNYQTLINLVPGTTPAVFQNTLDNTPARALSFNINGTNRNNNNTRVDGAVNVFLWLPHHTLYVPPVETIEAVNITTASFDAEQGLAGGAAVTVATKSGTNDFHGVASWYHDNQHLRARNFFLRSPGKPKSISNVATVAVGGPLKKDRLFFFAGYERNMWRRDASGNYQVPNPDQREGDFSAYPVTIYDPLSSTDPRARQPFSGNRIPLARQSAIVRKIQGSVPLPNLTGTLDNYAVLGNNSFDRDNYDVKINWHPSPRHAMFGKYSQMNAFVGGTVALGDAGGPALGTKGNGPIGYTRVPIATVGHTWTVSPTFLIDGAFGFNRYDQPVVGPDHGKNWGTDIWGIPGSNEPTGPGAAEVIKRCPATGCYSGQPRINNGYTFWGNGDSWMPQFRNDRSYIVNANASRIFRAHELRWGFDMARHHMDHWQPEVSGGPRGVINFDGSVTALSGGAPPNFYNTYAATLLGLVSSYSKALQFQLMTNREWQFGWYLRDRWQLSRKLTLNLGLRYEYYPLITRKDRGIERWDPQTNKVHLGGIGNVPRSAGMTTSKKLFGPRVGFAWRLNDSTVLRSGYGITFDPLPFSRPLRGLYPASIGGNWVSDSYAWFNRIDQGIPPVPVPDISSGIIDLPAAVDMGPRSAWAGEIHRGYIQSWNFTLERKLPVDWVTTIAYVGTQTVHQLLDIDINAGFPGSGTRGRPLYARLGRSITTAMWDGWASANYHSLQVALNRQLSQGLFMKGAYTWSKAISLSDDDGWASVGRNWLPELRWNRSRTGYDRTHMFALGWLYELPLGPNKTWAGSGLGARVLGNWQINGTFSAYTGTPFTIGASGASVNAPSNTQTADLVKPGQVRKIGRIGPGEQFYDATSFRSVSEVRFGNTGRNILTGPGIVNLNLSLFRSMSLTERLKMEFKAEAFNFTNTPHFNNPSTNVSNMVLNPDGSIRSLGNFMSVTGANIMGGQEPGDERQFRFGLRFSF
jgi:outer membrane receptor protein involved in Fe transport